MYRNVVELTEMVNNDEIVFYTDEKIVDLEKNFPKRNYFSNPRLRFSREVLREEISAGLKPIKGKIFETYAENGGKEVPFLTQLLDSLEVIKAGIAFHKKICSKDPCKRDNAPSLFLSNLVGSNYYDCMSSHMPASMLLCIHYLMDNYPSVNWDTDVYPGKEGSLEKWYTLRDFYGTTKDAVDALWKKYGISLPNLKKVLAENF